MSRKNRNTNIKATKRRAVMGKTGGLCWYCGDPPTTLDHVIPWARRKVERHVPRNHLDNLLPACYPCNQMKRNATLDEFRATIEKFFGLREFRFWGEQFLPLDSDI